MSLMRFSPSAELEEFPVGLRLFQDSVSRLFSEPSNRPWSPAVDIFETEHELVLKADVPEIEMKDIDVQVENGTLTLKAEYKSGVLTVTLSKKEVAKPKTIRVEINNN